jgi:TIR domain
MRVFLSYASEQRDLAIRLALALRSMRNNVFFDRDALPTGAAFDLRIRKAILRCHAFVFLASRQSLQAGAYTLSELGVAERRWAHPAGKVLPVLVDDTPIETLPAYLRAVSVLEPKGDIVAEDWIRLRALGSNDFEAWCFGALQ